MKRPTPADLELHRNATAGARLRDRARRADLWIMRALSVAAWCALLGSIVRGLAAGLGAA